MEVLLVVIVGFLACSGRLFCRGGARDLRMRLGSAWSAGEEEFDTQT